MYVLNGATGEVHEGSCPRLGRMHAANLVPWDPDKAHLALGARACTDCLTEVPAALRPLEGITDEEWGALCGLVEEGGYDTKLAEALWPGFTEPGGDVLRLGIEALLRSRRH